MAYSYQCGSHNLSLRRKEAGNSPPLDLQIDHQVKLPSLVAVMSNLKQYNFLRRVPETICQLARRGAPRTKLLKWATRGLSRNFLLKSATRRAPEINCVHALSGAHPQFDAQISHKVELPSQVSEFSHQRSSRNKLTKLDTRAHSQDNCLNRLGYNGKLHIDAQIGHQGALPNQVANISH